MIPNKRIENVIRIFHAYRTRFNPRSRLLLVGSHGGFEKYLTMLHQLVATLGTPDVHFSGHVSNEELAAYYDVADLFLCASEHEGFCVPLVEAFHMRVPVVAYAATAVPATLDGGGVLYEDRDPHHVAALVDAVAVGSAIADNVLASQDAALGRLLARTSAARCWASSTASPRRRAGPAARRVRLLGSAARVRAARGTADVPAGGVQGVAEMNCTAFAVRAACCVHVRCTGHTRLTGTCTARARVHEARSTVDDHQPVAARGASRRRDRRLGAPRARPAAGHGPRQSTSTR